ncbi:hypothetical protein F5Y18DRAFT_150035 [Xylariaceae sp. FL1019]|nr:hypothetical protein F5Y18DRAFT_150035 [Xylariaceae sp. FL1019]
MAAPQEPVASVVRAAVTAPLSKDNAPRGVFPNYGPLALLPVKSLGGSDVPLHQPLEKIFGENDKSAPIRITTEEFMSHKATLDLTNLEPDPSNPYKNRLLFDAAGFYRFCADFKLKGGLRYSMFANVVNDDYEDPEATSTEITTAHGRRSITKKPDLTEPNSPSNPHPWGVPNFETPNPWLSVTKDRSSASKASAARRTKTTNSVSNAAEIRESSETASVQSSKGFSASQGSDNNPRQTQSNHRLGKSARGRRREPVQRIRRC